MPTMSSISNGNGEGSSHPSKRSRSPVDLDDESDVDDALATEVQDHALLESDFLEDDASVQ